MLCGFVEVRGTLRFVMETCVNLAFRASGKRPVDTIHSWYCIGYVPLKVLYIHICGRCIVTCGDKCRKQEGCKLVGCSN